MSTIQFKRVKQYEGSFKDAVKHISALNLQPGEPFLCSYKENDEIRYFLAIGTTNRDGNTVKVFPVFSNFEDFSTFVKGKINIEPQSVFEEVSVDSQVVLDTTLGSDGKPRLIIPDLMWKHLDNN